MMEYVVLNRTVVDSDGRCDNLCHIISIDKIETPCEFQDKALESNVNCKYSLFTPKHNVEVQLDHF